MGNADVVTGEESGQQFADEVVGHIRSGGHNVTVEIRFGMDAVDAGGIFLEFCHHGVAEDFLACHEDGFFGGVESEVVGQIEDIVVHIGEGSHGIAVEHDQSFVVEHGNVDVSLMRIDKHPAVCGGAVQSFPRKML